MTKKQKLQKIQKLLSRLDELEGKNPAKAIERLLTEEEKVSRETLRESKTGTALKILSKALQNLQSEPLPVKIVKRLEKAHTATEERFTATDTAFQEKVDGLLEELRNSEQKGTEFTKKELENIVSRFAQYEADYETEKISLRNQDSLLSLEVARLAEELPKILARFDALPDLSPAIEATNTEIQVVKTDVKALEKELKDLEKKLSTKIGQIHGNDHGNGNANRSIVVGGNPNTLNYYTDINLKAGSNVTLTYTANHATKYTDVTISSSGSGGGGITREIDTIAISTAAGSTAGTDYVYICTSTLTLTLPTAVGNENLYTVKNTGSGTVTIDTTGGQTIDGDATVVMPLQYTSVDLISNGSNWSIT